MIYGIFLPDDRGRHPGIHTLWVPLLLMPQEIGVIPIALNGWSFRLLALIGLIWCCLALFGPKKN
jgi:hypothetical protein